MMIRLGSESELQGMAMGDGQCEGFPFYRGHNMLFEGTFALDMSLYFEEFKIKN